MVYESLRISQIETNIETLPPVPVVSPTGCYFVYCYCTRRAFYAAASYIVLISVPSKMSDGFFWVAAIGDVYIGLLYLLAFASLIIRVISSLNMFAQLLPYRRYFVWSFLFLWCWVFYSPSALVAMLNMQTIPDFDNFLSKKSVTGRKLFWVEPVIESVLAFVSLLPCIPVLLLWPYVAAAILRKLHVVLVPYKKRVIRTAGDSWFFLSPFSGNA